eukprot:scaffold2995_cov130-Cylindrotheca_fusiformis.AAC.2
MECNRGPIAACASLSFSSSILNLTPHLLRKLRFSNSPEGGVPENQAQSAAVSNIKEDTFSISIPPFGKPIFGLAADRAHSTHYVLINARGVGLEKLIDPLPEPNRTSQHSGHVSFVLDWTFIRRGGVGACPRENGVRGFAPKKNGAFNSPLWHSNWWMLINVVRCCSKVVLKNVFSSETGKRFMALILLGLEKRLQLRNLASDLSL